MIPGTSRSGSTIIGALLLGLAKGVAAEFSFFLAIPTMMGATLLKVVKNGLSFTPLEWQLLGIGFVVSFIVAYVVFSFFLAIPTMMGATLLKVVKNGLSFTPLEWQLLGIGFVVSFIVAYVVIKWFMGYIKTKTFRLFGIYRIILGILVLLFLR